MLAKTTSCHFEGLATEPVTVETQILGGFSQFYIVGLAGTSIQEARERIRSAIVSMGIRLPPGRIVVNLYPGDVPKGGTQWDLPIAVTLLAAMGALEPSLLETVAFRRIVIGWTLSSSTRSICHGIDTPKSRH